MTAAGSHTQDLRSALWGWRGVSVLILFVLEALWAGLMGSSLLARPDSFVPLLLLVGGILGLGYFLNSLAMIWQVKTAVNWTVLAVLGFFSLWLALELILYWPRLALPWDMLAAMNNEMMVSQQLPAEVLVVLVVLLAWLRGLTLARAGIYTETLLTTFWTGTLSLVVFHFQSPERQPMTFAILFVFVFLGLVGMSTARLGEVAELRGGRAARFNLRWLGNLAGGALLVVLAAGLAALLALSPVGQLVGLGILIALSFVTGLLMQLMAPLLDWLVNYLAQFVERNGAINPNSSIAQQIADQLEQMNQQQEAVEPLMSQVLPILIWSVVIGLLVLMAVALIRRKWHERRARLEGIEEDASLAAMLRDLGQAVKDRAQQTADDLARLLHLRNANRMIQAARIRWVYSQLMALCVDLGCPRLTAQTPLEFLPLAAQKLPEAKDEMNLMTGAYLKVRYGELPESDGEVNDVMEAWKRVQMAARQKK
ncbi:MAG TPA: DUF4129 domain-containing protein [Anaerolineaceae bacterium]|nr:DUF4129 domain-containing protein [Anaerolineaceae bacterium]HPN52836.1 DUF4129 domain-containing protein [Anaerolineaceae bacterium]